MGVFDRYFGGQKFSESRMVSSMMQLGQAVYSPANFNSYTKYGYMGNATVYTCISKITQAAKDIKIIVYTKKKGGNKVEVTEGELVELLRRPNPLQSWADFVESSLGWFLISGDSYTNSTVIRGNMISELWPVRPDKMVIEVGKKGYPAAYIYKDNGAEKRWDVDFIKMTSQILHMKMFNPVNMWYGMSPMQALMMSLDQAKAANKWNLSMLQNSATPSGVLQMKATESNPRGALTKEQRLDLKEEIDDAYQGAKNAGRPMILQGGLSWQTISLSMKDMDYSKGKEASASDIALAYGVPLELIGLGQKTFNNYDAAKASFYMETVIPLLNKFINELNRWCVPAFGEELEIAIDIDSIEALSSVRNAKFTAVSGVNFLTQNEKRAAVGYEEMPGWDVFVIGQAMGAKPEDFATGGTPEEPTDGDDPDSDESDPSDEGDDSDSSDESDESDNSLNSDDEKDVKAFNPVTKNDRVRTWRYQNRKKEMLENSMKRQVAAELNDINQHIVDRLSLMDNVLTADSAAIDMVIRKELAPLRKTIGRHIEWTLEEFGTFIFDDAKKQKFYQHGMEFKANRRYQDAVKEYVATRTGNAVSDIVGTTRKKTLTTIRRLVEENINGESVRDELASALLKDLNGLTPSRANTIARTEVGSASQHGSLEAVKSLQIPNMEKGWVSAKDARVRDGGDTGDDANHEAMDDVWVGLEEKFAVPPDADMDAPGDPAGGASQICNCRCVLVYRVRN